MDVIIRGHGSEFGWEEPARDRHLLCRVWGWQEENLRNTWLRRLW